MTASGADEGQTHAGRSPTGAPTIVISALSYKRPDLLEKLLDTWPTLAIPGSVRTVLLIVDNDEAGSARSTVEARQSDAIDLRYVVEARKGIPVARNRALDEALAMGADALCFIDDDEYPDQAWIDRLLACWRKTGAQLLGGPVEVAPAPEGATAWQTFINQSLAARASRRNRKTARAAATSGRYTIVTNNWLCDLGWQRETGLRFDESLLATGGSDTAFFRAARAMGCRTDWCPEAIVYETVTLDRLSMSYQFWRASSQSMNHLRMKKPRIGPVVFAATVANACLRAVLGAALVVVPVFGMASPVMGVRSMGWALGRLKGLFGSRSKLYE
ncbi:MAG: glycosyltransferase [Pseudomonadota bacterium]|nr:glycosyltransferase [Pseudomonadota bacterium]